MKALVVDDSKSIRMILHKTLGDVGFSVTEAADGKEALLRAVHGDKPDLILVDWNMPELNGLGFIEAIRGKPDFDNVKLMMVTTEHEIDNITAAQIVGVDEYVVKPFTTEIILEKLDKMGFSQASKPLQLLRKLKGMVVEDATNEVSEEAAMHSALKITVR